MKIYPEELQCAKEFNADSNFPSLAKEQLEQIYTEGKKYRSWYRQHPYLHNTINVFVVATIFIFDAWALISFPEIFSTQSYVSDWKFILFASVTVGFLHGFSMYSVIIFTMHEGAFHDLIIQKKGKISTALNFLVNNASRLFSADPEYYKPNHMRHHKYFGTDQDGSFTNFVLPVRIFKSLLPFASVMKFNDYKAHTGPERTKSLTASQVLSISYLLLFCFILIPKYGYWYPLLTLLLIAPWVAFTLDRVRESTDHNLMPLDNNNGSRNMGINFWSLIIGGGPWGQPCHLSHHLMPSLPWYHQLMLHKKIVSLLTDEQRKHFTAHPIYGYPLVFYRLIKEDARILKSLRAKAVK